MLSKLALPLLSLGLVEAHYTFPWINVNGVNSTYWQYTRQTNNYNALSPVTDVTSSDLRCYDSAVSSSPATYSIAAGSTVSVGSDPGGVCCGQYHPGVSLVYMAQVPSGTNAATWEPTNAVWFKVGEVPPITDGGTSIVWQAQNAQYVTFTIPKATPSGTYLVRVENIALHSATAVGGAQFYISCSLFTVTGGGNGTPGPLVAIPGVYTGHEPGILINIYYPIPATYTMPGPAIWTGGASSGSTTGGGGTTGTPTTVRPTTTTTTTTTTKTASGPTQTAYGQCGGTGWTGATTCVAGYKCSATNTYYSQCVPN